MCKRVYINEWVCDIVYHVVFGIAFASTNEVDYLYFLNHLRANTDMY